MSRDTPPARQDCFVKVTDGDPLPDGAKVTLAPDYTDKLQRWLDSQPRAELREAPTLRWAGEVGVVVRSHSSLSIGLRFYRVRFPGTEHLDAWYLRSELVAISGGELDGGVGRRFESLSAVGGLDGVASSS